MKVLALHQGGYEFLAPSDVEVATNCKVATLVSGQLVYTPYTSLTTASSVKCRDDSLGAPTTVYKTAGDIGLVNSYKATILADSPVGYWRLNDSGRTATDLIGTNHGTMTSGVGVRAPGPLVNGASCRFDGTQGKISFANPAQTGTFSLEAWVYLLDQGFVGSTDYQCLFGIDAAHRFLLRVTTGEILCQMGGGNVQSATGAIVPGVWQHIVYTRNGSNQNVYVNAANVATLATAGASFNAAFFIGSYASTSVNYSFTGRISEAAIYNTELSPAQVSAHYAARPDPTTIYPLASPPSITSSQIQVTTNAAAPLSIDTPDGSGQVVEPCIEYVPGGWNGKKWFGFITGYTNGDNTKENPSFYYSDDGQNFVRWPASPFPVVAKPATGNNADPEIRVGPDGRMYGFYITFGFPASQTTVWVVSSSDGTNWSTPVQCFTTVSTAESATGPVVLYDEENACWNMWYVDSHGAGVFPLKRKTCQGTDPTGTWSSGVTCTVNGLPGGRAPFEAHVERYNATQLHMVVTFCDQGTGGANTTLHFGVSNDNGYTWTFNSTPFLTTSASGWDNTQVYRGDIGPVIGGGSALYGFWYSGKNAGGVWRWGYTTISKTG